MLRKGAVHLMELYKHLFLEAFEIVLRALHVRSSHFLIADVGLALRSEGIGKGQSLHTTLKAGFLLRWV